VKPIAETGDAAPARTVGLPLDRSTDGICGGHRSGPVSLQETGVAAVDEGPVLYVSPQFPKTRHGMEAVELEVLFGRRSLEVISLRVADEAAERWLREGFPSIRRSAIWAITGVQAVLSVAALLVTRPLQTARVAGRLVRATRRDLTGCSKALLSFALGCALARRARARKAVWIHADFASAPATAAFVAGSLTGLRWSFTGHAFDVFSTRPAGRATEELLALKLAHASAVFAANTGAKARLDEIAEAHGVAGRAIIKRNGTRLRPRPHRLRGPGDAFVVVGLGALVEKKGFDTLIRAADIAASDIPQLRVEIHGEGPERPALEALAAQVDVPVSLPGWYSYASLPDVLATADAVVMPARRLDDGDSDGTPLALVEAVVGGVPIIATPVGSITDLVVDGDTGLLVPPDDAPALAAALVSLAADPALAGRLAVSGARLASTRFSPEANADVFIQALVAVGAQL
jgi:glycosyltransferase involved in cell wall biosynthesis